MERNLTRRQQIFVSEYLVDLNATKAAVRAGYSAKTAGWQGSQLIEKTQVAQAIADRMAEREKRTAITQDRVLLDIDLIKQDAMSKKTDDDGFLRMVDRSAALKACELLGKHLGMFTDKLALTIESIPDEDLDGRIAELLRKTGVGTAAGGEAAQAGAEKVADLLP